MKKRILCLLLTLIMLVGAFTALTACGDGGGDNDNPCAKKCQKVNEDADGKCDICGKAIRHACVDNDDNGYCDVCSKDESAMADAYPAVPWINDAPVELFFMMSKNSNDGTNLSGCERYLAGEDKSAIGEIDDKVSMRNADAEYYTNVSLSYDYYDDIDEHGWGKCMELMFQNVKTDPRGAPDMYCNFTYDMVGTSLKGTFANLKNKNLDQGNFFSFLADDYKESLAAGDDKGYMYDYMESLTLSQEKMYVLASDYFIDLIRSFYVVPVNVKLLEGVGAKLTGNQNYSLDDFYDEVRAKKWTYDRVAEFSSAVYSNTGTANSGEDIEDVLGFVLSWGDSSSGIIYSTDIKVINKEWVAAKGDYEYSYPTESPDLYKLFDNIGTLVESTGVHYIKHDEPNYKKYGASLQVAIRERFCDNKILFGDIIMVGSLEYDSYQRLKDSSGFGVVPVPLYLSEEEITDENYLTSIHNTARPGGIARNTDYFTACTAFLDYQSTHSTEILNEYYDYNLQYNVADGSKGTVEMLQYIRYNVRSAFDKTFEDAIGVYNNAESYRWSYILEVQDFNYDIRVDYKSYADTKDGWLKELYNEYPKLP